MLSNAYCLAKFRFDTAENEPAKNLQNFRKMHLRKMHFRKMRRQPHPGHRPHRLRRGLLRRRPAAAADAAGRGAGRGPSAGPRMFFSALFLLPNIRTF